MWELLYGSIRNAVDVVSRSLGNVSVVSLGPPIRINIRFDFFCKRGTAPDEKVPIFVGFSELHKTSVWVFSVNSPIFRLL